MVAYISVRISLRRYQTEIPHVWMDMKLKTKRMSAVNDDKREPKNVLLSDRTTENDVTGNNSAWTTFEWNRTRGE